jgi:hypothetical protein
MASSMTKLVRDRLGKINPEPDVNKAVIDQNVSTNISDETAQKILQDLAVEEADLNSISSETGKNLEEVSNITTPKTEVKKKINTKKKSKNSKEMKK